MNLRARGFVTNLYTYIECDSSSSKSELASCAKRCGVTVAAVVAAVVVCDGVSSGQVYQKHGVRAAAATVPAVVSVVAAVCML
jgi:hypothetical protein